MLTISLFMSLILLSSAANADKYNSKYDDINLDEVLKSERLIQNYIKCLLNEGPCTPDAKMLKGN